MLDLFDPTKSRTAQLKAFSSAMNAASNRKERASILRQAVYGFAVILKRNHDNVDFSSYVLMKPLEHFEVITSMPKNWQKSFAALPLSEKDKEPLRLYAEESENNPFEPLENLLGLGYKVSILWSDSSQSFIVSVIGTEECKHNSDMVLSSFTDDLSEAFFMCGYKVLILAKGGDWPSEKDSSRWG